MRRLNMHCKFDKADVIFYKWPMLYTRLALPVAVCIAIRGIYTRLAWLANLTLTLTLQTLHTAIRTSLQTGALLGYV